MTVGVVAALGIGTETLFPDALGLVKTKIESVTSNFMETNTGLNQQLTVKPISLRDNWLWAQPSYANNSAALDAKVAELSSGNDAISVPISEVPNGLSYTNLTGSGIRVEFGLYYVIDSHKKVINQVSDIDDSSMYNAGLIFTQDTTVNGKPDVRESYSNIWVKGSVLKSLISKNGFSLISHDKYSSSGDSLWDSIYEANLKSEVGEANMSKDANITEAKNTVKAMSYIDMFSDAKAWNYNTLVDLYKN